MCGIVGLIDCIKGSVPPELLASLAKMMRARGPNGSGHFVSGPVGMAMRRLSVIDLDGGTQPFYSRAGRVVAFQNGEIYNHRLLRQQLERHGHFFKSKSDTEVVAHGYAEWGADGLVERLDGMFALAILDLDRRELHLARDRFGEKPLFYTAVPGRFAYASDLAVLASLPWVNLEIDTTSLDRYLALHFVPGDITIFKRIFRVLPGERLIVSIDDPQPRTTVYYHPSLEQNPRSDEELADIVVQAVETRLLADVPVGIFLSGGLDSSIVSAIAARQQRHIATFSMGFGSAAHDESAYARAVAASIGSDHHHFVFDKAEFDSLLPKVASALDEPAGDQALLPLYWLCQEARQHVTVVLSGEGADEVFGGYNYYSLHGDCATFDSLIENSSNVTPSGFPLLQQRASRRRLLLGNPEPISGWETKWIAWLNQSADSLQRATAADLTTWLPDDLLVKLDRMTMAHSLEGRAPYLAPSLVAAGLGLPPHERLNGGFSKVALRRVAARWLPPAILARPKQGFVLPMQKWLPAWFRSHGGVSSFFSNRPTPGLDMRAVVDFVNQDLLVGIRHERSLFALVLLAEWHHAFMKRRGATVGVHRCYYPQGARVACNGARPASHSDLAISDFQTHLETRTLLPASLDFDGQLDQCGEYNSISGWGRNKQTPADRAVVDIFVDDVYQQSAVCNVFRRDLLEAGIGDGCHSFTVPIHRKLRDDRSHVIAVRFKDSDQEINGSPRVFSRLLLKQQRYKEWIDAHDTRTDDDRLRIRKRIAKLTHCPIISLVLPIVDQGWTMPDETIASVTSQLYPHWELCVAFCGGPPDKKTQETIDRLCQSDRRIKLPLGTTPARSSSPTQALALATGDYVAFLEQGSTLPEHTLYVCAQWINQLDPDVVYSDEDFLDENGERTDPHFKPDFNYSLLLGSNYFSNLLVVRRAISASLGSPTFSSGGSDNYAYSLRAVECASSDKIIHIPHVLYHSRRRSGIVINDTDCLGKATQSDLRAIQGHLKRTKTRGVAAIGENRFMRIRWPLPASQPFVSVIIPTRDQSEVLSVCLDTLKRLTAYPTFEIIIVDHCSSEPGAVCLLKRASQSENSKVVRFNGDFNYSALVNYGAQFARGDLLCFINNDVEVIDSHWLEEMVTQCCRSGVGAVGAKLLYPDEHVQHGGIILGHGGVAGHAHRYYHRLHNGYWGRLQLAQELAAVTAACLLVRRPAFDEVDGFDADNLPRSFNDVDLCLRIREKGHHIVWTPHAVLRHHESYSRGQSATGADLEIAYMKKRWNSVLLTDPHYNPNLTLMSELDPFAAPQGTVVKLS